MVADDHRELLRDRIVDPTERDIGPVLNLRNLRNLCFPVKRNKDYADFADSDYGLETSLGPTSLIALASLLFFSVPSVSLCALC